MTLTETHQCIRDQVRESRDFKEIWLQLQNTDDGTRTHAGSFKESCKIPETIYIGRDRTLHPQEVCDCARPRKIRCTCIHKFITFLGIEKTNVSISLSLSQFLSIVTPRKNFGASSIHKRLVQWRKELDQVRRLRSPGSMVQ